MNAASQPKQWISGPICTEWLIHSPLNYCVTSKNPAYRDFEKGLLKMVQHDILENGVNGEMISYTGDIMHGYQVILKTALAYEVDSGTPGADEAWALTQARAKKPDFNHGACYQWTILPRSLENPN